ncbi:MAG: glycine cleavage system aminomethyltransferase GcvT [Rhodospirillaceae bacterium]|nr:glycine cleavage system aminomethyltransferase GcvT [Rhodospirillaceae bacterium]MBL6930008.1 glycine cleavage system aminomethyltransferase GcvT [Rhodospirillales bacterium]MBL6941496.1 glycine cleavage system aminomethyltransferase GcvT [Rhodospirillales bacterium]
MADHSQDLKKTPLDALHRELGAKMVPFAGYEMPVQYSAGILSEHLHTRERASLFDVSHMGQAAIRGEGPVAALESLVPGDLAALSDGQMRYTMFTNEQGGILDDLMVTRRGDHLFLIVNAACKDQDYALMEAGLPAGNTLEVIEGQALLALQGPQAATVLGRLAPAVRLMDFMTSEPISIGDIHCIISRSGYSGEDGYEISLPGEDAERLARLLLNETEVRVAGLGARDSLRLEAGLCLYGSDIDETTTPIQAGLIWTISKRRRAEGGFPGAAVIQDEIENGAPRKRVGIKPEGKAPARAHTEITDKNGTVIGEITSGGFGPSVKGPVAMGYVKTEFAKPETAVDLMVRGKAQPAQVFKLPFSEHRYYKG